MPNTIASKFARHLAATIIRSAQAIADHFEARRWRRRLLRALGRRSRE